MFCFLMNIQLMNVPPAPESMIAVVSMLFELRVAKSVRGTRNSVFVPTVLVTRIDLEGANIEVGLLFKNPFSYYLHRQILLHRRFPRFWRSPGSCLHHQVFYALPIFLFLSPSDGNWSR